MKDNFDDIDDANVDITEEELKRMEERDRTL